MFHWEANWSSSCQSSDVPQPASFLIWGSDRSKKRKQHQPRNASSTNFEKERQMRQARYWIYLLPLFLILACVGAWAQENAVLTGTVTDPSGAVVANASVLITNTRTSETRSATTNGDGLYEFPALEIGTYTLKVSATGFKVYEETGIVMNVAATVREDVKLSIGASSQTVTVAADVLTLQTETNEVSNLISGQQITELATNGRSLTSLETLGTGVSGTLPEFNGTSAQGSSSTISFNGMRTGHNDFLVDGGEIYDRGSGGKLGVMPSIDAVAEFQTLSSNYEPDYGIASGGTTTIVLKSGGNSYHGGLWEFDRNDDFDALPYFTKQAAVQNHTAPTIPELRLNIYGGNFGGQAFIPGIYPKSKSHTYFFVTEEWRRMIQGSPANLTNAPTASEIPTTANETSGFAYTPPTGLPESPAAGVCAEGQTAPCVPATTDEAKLALYTADDLTIGESFSNAPGGKIPGNLLDKNAVLFMGTGAIPTSNTTGPNGQPVIIASPKQPTYVREDVVRVDHDISPRMHLMGHWIHDRMSQTYFPNQNWGDGDSYTTAGDVFGNPSWGTVIKLTQTISPTVLNETSLNVNGNYIKITAVASPGASIAEPAGWTQTGFFPAANNIGSRMPGVHMGAPFGTTWSIGYWPWANAYLNYQPRDDLSWTKGRHAFKFGFAYMRNDKNQQQQADTEGDYNFGTDFSGDSYANFLLGDSDSFSQLESLSMFHWINNTWSVYGMDNWRITPRLTLNLGIRYDGLPHVYNKENDAGNFVPADFSAATEQVPNASTGQMNTAGPGFQTVNGVPFYLDGIELAGKNGFPIGVVKNDYWTWEPRLGFAYDLFGNGKTVLRGGIGTFYERVQGNDIYGTDTNPPFAYQPTADDVYFTNPATSDTNGATASTPTFPAGLGTLDYYYPNPGTAQFSLGIQHQFAPALVAAVQYVGSAGWNQDVKRQINTLPLASTERQAVATTGANANLYRNFPGFSGIDEDDNTTNSNYNSLQAALGLENKHGFTLHLGYTWSHEIDIQSDDLQGDLSDPYNIRYDRGSGSFDRRHILTANYIYNVPFFMHSGSLLQRSLLGGWTISGVTTSESGLPAKVGWGGADTIGLGGGTSNRPTQTGAVSYPHTVASWFSTSAFSAPMAPWAGGTNQGWGVSGKAQIRLNDFQDTNLSLFKSFALTKSESTRIEIRFESFDTFNHPLWNGFNTGYSSPSSPTNITSTDDPRVMQFGGKFLF
jgi:hypothetical protein